MRSGLENAVAVYSFSAVRPAIRNPTWGRVDAPLRRRPQDQPERPRNDAEERPAARPDRGRNACHLHRSGGQQQAVCGNQARAGSHAESFSRNGSENRQEPGGPKAEHHASDGQAAMPSRIESGASVAWSAFSLRGRAQKVIPKALTKQAAASAAVNASSAPAMGKSDAGQARCRAEAGQQA